MKTQNNIPPEKKGGLGESFNNSVFSGTTHQTETQDEVFLMGKGININDFEVMEKRAKRKLLTKTMAMLLISIAREDQDWKWEARFSATLNCQDEQTSADGWAHTEYYCKQRCCLICLANRKAQIIDRYLPIVQQMPAPHFVTLTLVSVKKDDLKWRVNDIVKAIRTLIARYKKRHQRGKQEKFYGLWSLESNFNPLRLTYNPHIHLILPTEYAAETFRKDWLEYWGERKVKIDVKAQHYRKVENSIEDLIEIVKYGSKIFTEPDIAVRMKYKLPRKPSFLYVKALYNILKAMDGHDVFNTFGFPTPKQKPPRKLVKKVKSCTKWNYDLSIADWIDDRTGLRLAKYKVPNELEALLQSRVNRDFE